MSDVGTGRYRAELLRGGYDGDQNVTRTCKLSTLLQDDYQWLREVIRVHAEYDHVARRDTWNLLNLHLRRWCEQEFVQFPPIANPQLYHKAFQLVTYHQTGRDPNIATVQIRAIETFRQQHPWFVDLEASYDIFQQCRQNEAGMLRYNVPFNTPALNYVGYHHSDTMSANAKLHLRSNLDTYMIRIWVGFFRDLQSNTNIALNKKERKYGKAAVNRIKQHLGFRNEEQDDAQQWFAGIPPQALQVIQEFYQNFQQRYDQEFGAETLFEAIVDAENDGALQDIMSFIYWLRGFADEFQVKTWSILPVASHQIGYFDIDSTTLYHLLKQAHQENALELGQQYNIPAQMFENNAFITSTRYRQLLIDFNWKEALWEEIFNLDHVQRNRRRFQNTDEQNEGRKLIMFDHHISSDGVGVSVAFLTRRVARYPSSQADFQALDIPQRRNMPIEEYQGIVQLTTHPLFPQQVQGTPIMEACRIIGLDPGIRELFSAASGDDNLHDRNARRQQFLSLSNREYQVRSNYRWIVQKELQSRQVAGIEDVYRQLSASPSSAHTSAQFQDYLRTLSIVHEDLEAFNRGFYHREHRERSKAGRQHTMDVMADYIVMGSAKPPLQSVLKTSKRERAFDRRMARTMYAIEHDIEPNRRPTIVSYGDADLRGTMKSHAPLPTKHFRQVLARKSLVVSVNEFRTSKVCASCDEELAEVVDPNTMICNHRKKYINEREGNHYHRRLYCLDPEENPMHRTSVCEERVPVGVNDPLAIIYPIKVCPHCESENVVQARLAGLEVNPPTALIVNRDVNAALNMRRILIAYIQENNNLNSRPAALTRAPPPQQEQ